MRVIVDIGISFSANILLGKHIMSAKVSDFGLAKNMPRPPPSKSYIKVDSFRGTRAYSADEYMDGQCSALGWYVIML